MLGLQLLMWHLLGRCEERCPGVGEGVNRDLPENIEMRTIIRNGCKMRRMQGCNQIKCNKNCSQYFDWSCFISLNIEYTPSDN